LPSHHHHQIAKSCVVFAYCFQALLALEDMLAGLDVRDDMAVLLDQALSPALTFLCSGSASEKLDAATLLGSICEKRPGAAGFLVAEGALPAVTQLLISGGYNMLAVLCCRCVIRQSGHGSRG
jgi:hypothetical protein